MQKWMERLTNEYYAWRHLGYSRPESVLLATPLWVLAIYFVGAILGIAYLLWPGR